MNKKHRQLGINYSTASGRLIKDILFSFIKEKGVTCFYCGGELTRETFSIEHKTPWLDSKEPKKLFYDLNNIGYSHKSCNSKAARRIGKQYKKQTKHGTSSVYQRGCRCSVCNAWNNNRRKKQKTKPV